MTPPGRCTAIFLAGIAAGTINTVVGSGTLITFPTLLAFGVPPVTANVSNTLGLVPGLAVRVRSATGASSPASARGVLRLGSASVLGGLTGAVLLLVLPAAAFDAIVPVLIALGLRARRAPARDQPPGAPAPRPAASSGPSTARWWVWLLVFAHRRVRRLLRRRPGRAADGGPRHRPAPRPCSASTPPRTCWRCSSTLVAAVRVHLRRPDVDWAVVALIAVGSSIGGQLGATVGRRLPPWALRVFIVVVGVAALARFAFG